ncbi:hypothetical protein FOL47_001437 [Perkinsus chesapeaki]|uniref:Transmembrane protein n=1 Tax=Perkinsus chesapeaki TaxID=330153 RepID=A0A7J6MJH4_PERCH|nr:hypothetical protein FOL47_001437 [Perkinsus chesapeaki]
MSSNQPTKDPDNDDDARLVHAFTEALYDHEARLERHLTRIMYESNKASAQPSMWVRAYLVVLLCIGVTALLGLNYVLLYPFLQTLFWVIVAYLLLFPPKQLVKALLLSIFNIHSSDHGKSPRKALVSDRNEARDSSVQDGDEKTEEGNVDRIDASKPLNLPLSPFEAILKMSLRQAKQVVKLSYHFAVYILLPRDDGGSSLYFRILWRVLLLYLYFWKFAWAFPAAYNSILWYTVVAVSSSLVVRWLCGLGKVFLYLHSNNSKRKRISSVMSSGRRSRSRRVSEVKIEEEGTEGGQQQRDDEIGVDDIPSESECPSSEPDSIDDTSNEEASGQSPLGRISQKLFTVSYDGLMKVFSWGGKVCNNFIKSNADFISTTSVMITFSVLGTVLAAYIGYNISLEFAYIWDALASLFRGARSLLEMKALHPYKQYAELAYSAASDAVSHFIETDAVTTKTKDLYNYIEMVISGSNSSSNATVQDMVPTGDGIFLQCAGTFPACSYARGVEDIFNDGYSIGKSGYSGAAFGNTTEVARLLQNWNLKTLATSPSLLLSAYKEVKQYYDSGESVDHAVNDTSGNHTASGAAAIIGGLLMDVLTASGHASLAGIQFSLSVVSGIIGTLVDSLFHFFFAVTALYYLLQSEQGGLHDYMATVLQVIDPSFYLYNILRRALKAILYSAIKMAIFHGIYTWLVFSIFDCPVAYIPACIAFIIGLLPVPSSVEFMKLSPRIFGAEVLKSTLKIASSDYGLLALFVSPCLVSFFIVPYIFLAYDRGLAQACGTVAAILNFLVWWYVGPAIYSEIPDANPWMSAVAVGLGVSWFGARGVILGPAIATVPFTLYTVASDWHAGKCGPSGLNRSASMAGLLTPRSEPFDGSNVAPVPSGLFEHLLRQAKQSFDREFGGTNVKSEEDSE